jgi:hypothetical protein
MTPAARGMRNLAGLAASALAAACASHAPSPSDPVPYLDDAAYRRTELEASLVNRDNAYSSLRLDHYATGKAGEWDSLPEWNPDVDRILAGELEAAEWSKRHVIHLSA